MDLNEIRSCKDWNEVLSKLEMKLNNEIIKNNLIIEESQGDIDSNPTGKNLVAHYMVKQSRASNDVLCKILQSKTE
jgi:hypothetical protein